MTDQNLPSSSDIRSSIRFLLRFERFYWDIAGVFTLMFAALTLIALLGLSRGSLLEVWAALLRRWLGWGSGLVVVVAAVTGIMMLRRQKGSLVRMAWGRVMALEGAAFALLALLALSKGESLQRAEAGLDGGLVGWGLAKLFTNALPPLLAGLLLGLFVVVMTIIGLGIWSWFIHQAQQLQGTTVASYAGPAPRVGSETSASILSEGQVQPTITTGAGAPTLQKKKPPRLEAEFRKNFRVTSSDERPAKSLPRDERLPPLNILEDERSNRPNERHINLTAGLIEKSLAEFGLPAKVVGFQVGPTVTQFAVEPGFMEKPGAEGEAARQKVRVAQISALSRDLALALAVPRLRIEAPVPGRPYVGIEVPNARSTLVRLRPLLEAETFQMLNSPLAIALGRDVSGRAVVADMVKMPHLLIAGTTGSGKSVCITALTTCLVMNNTPGDLRLVMIDPKMVELVRFNGLPHLLGKVETDIRRILGVLRWIVVEMDRRYKLLEQTHSRHLDSYNRKMSHRKDGEVLPRIVVLVDELADLMMTAPDQTEHALVRLAQMARATGIHLVVATQRPSVDVVTGLIKANFPARLSFAVASGVDSRVILDTQGAESLLGRGDMLFMPPNVAAPIRAQGAVVTDQEIERLIAFWQGVLPQAQVARSPWEDLLAEEESRGDHDALLDQAIAIVRQTQRANASLLQRRLKIGYPRAARLIDEMEIMGIVGPSQGGGRDRDVLIEPEE